MYCLAPFLILFLTLKHVDPLRVTVANFNRRAAVCPSLISNSRSPSILDCVIAKASIQEGHLLNFQILTSSSEGEKE